MPSARRTHSASSHSSLAAGKADASMCAQNIPRSPRSASLNEEAEDLWNEVEEEEYFCAGQKAAAPSTGPGVWRSGDGVCEESPREGEGACIRVPWSTAARPWAQSVPGRAPAPPVCTDETPPLPKNENEYVSRNSPTLRTWVGGSCKTL